ncbi:metallo-hydrolase/oxidoreductase [Rhizobium leguminosarum]|uniref:metallo-hydrolase/oxidoreductase n=1 Tax=Rhizobium leguminosarum TaxID=384 RepID=UPI001C962EEC|nr:metallo-hydrolase/oxidoreductase [Rhizobium leguminosarum]MBY5608720.1 metallo-hydrolase/oxidoreductase [Rhizobium leguminosarum]MBY5657294.1 metallo-hydrolase/oxidoreductase [Rhizobium leguminosarum]
MFIKIPRSRPGEADFPRVLYARLSRFDYLSNREYKRASIEFDGIDAEKVDGITNVEERLFTESSHQPFALIRIITTRRRFEGVLGAPPAVGTWFRLRIEPQGPGLMTWQAQMGPDGYYAQSRMSTTGGGPLLDPLEPPRGPSPRSLGAAVAKEPLPTSIAELSSRFTVETDWSPIEQILQAVPPPKKIVIRDVGQASFASFLNAAGQSYLHFDTGLPVSWNAHTAPKSIGITFANDQLVVLSHWDWDHLHAAFSIKQLLDAKWIVPSQRLGPGAARLAMAIAKKGNLFVWPAGKTFNSSHMSIAECKGSPKNANNTGLALRAKLQSGREALLSGDADYSNIPVSLKAPADFLLVTHHGAAMAQGSTPIGRASKTGFAAVSYGAGNSYRHPNDATQQHHTLAGWGHWRTTARRPSRPRDNRYFT